MHWKFLMQCSSVPCDIGLPCLSTAFYLMFYQSFLMMFPHTMLKRLQNCLAPSLLLSKPFFTAYILLVMTYFSFLPSFHEILQFSPFLSWHTSVFYLLVMTYITFLPSVMTYLSFLPSYHDILQFSPFLSLHTSLFSLLVMAYFGFLPSREMPKEYELSSSDLSEHFSLWVYLF